MSEGILRSVTERSPAFAVSAAFFLNGGLFGTWASRVVFFKERFAITADTLGFLLLLLAAGAVVSFPLAGRAIGHVGAVRLTRWLAVAFCLALVPLALTPSLPGLGVALFLFGAGHGAMDVAMNAWGGEVERAARRPLMPGFHAMYSLGAGFGALCGAAAIAGGLGVAGHMIGFSALLGTLALLAMQIDWQSERHHVDGSVATGKVTLTSGLLLLGGIAFATSLGEGAMADWSAVYLVERLAATESVAALGYAVFSVTMVLTRLAGNWLTASFGARGVVQWSGAATLAGTSLSILAPGVPATLAGFALMGTGLALVMPLAFSRAAREPGMPPGRAIATVATIGYSGMLLGPVMIGYLAAQAGFAVAFSLIALAGLLILLSAGRFGR